MEPLLHAPTSHPRGGRPEKHPRRDLVDAILYVVRTGCAFRQLPVDFPPWETDGEHRNANYWWSVTPWSLTAISGVRGATDRDDDMAFKRRTSADLVPDDPEQLYRQLALVNDGPEALWAHQADVLRSWHGGHPDDPDVAIELPTGAGKTLVGGLIGEFRRRIERERVAYLCPTRQLARQTASKLDEYGIPNVLLFGDSKAWNPADYIGTTRAGLSR